MEFRILGSLEVVGEGRQLAPQQPKRRALLAVLLLRCNQTVPTDQLIDALWGGVPPKTAATALHGHVSALRRLLGMERIETGSGGYLLRLEAGQLDMERFETLVAKARRLSDPGERGVRLREALGLWRGEPLADFCYDAFAQTEISRLEDLHLAVLEDRIEAELESGQHFMLVAELEKLVSAYPLRERLRAQLMLALYRSGRQAEALHVFQEGRRLLAAELGINPGSALQALERQILVQDQALEAPRAASPHLPRQERKRVTAVVTELVGGDAAQDPEVLQALVEPVLGTARAVLERFGATVQPLFANALLAVFGAPRAHEDDAERAIRGALELREAVAGASLALRAGVDSGEALVTVDGERVEVTGDVLTAAARLQATAPLNAILVGEPVYRATQDAIVYQQAASGACLAIAARRPIRAHDFDPPESPFVGREDELMLLERCCARALRERSVQLVTIAGEPGAGKTRLIRELRTRLEASLAQHVWREGRCLPYGDGVTYWALGEVIKVQCGILESDGTEESTRKLAAAVAALVPEHDDARAWLEGRLAALVGIEAAAASSDREQSFAAWRLFLERIAWQQPLILAFEDIHWADEAMLEFVDDLVERTDAPTLVLCTTRLELLEKHSDWSGGKHNAITITLAPLGDDEVEVLLRDLLGREVMPEEVKRAGGNPFFAHELARLSAVPAEAREAVPESIHALIAARLDTLPPELKALASDAAVVGDVFWSGALASMGGTDEEIIEGQLQRLVNHEVVRRAGRSSVRRQSEFAFLHALVRDVAYNQIPRRARVRKHKMAAGWIEQLAGQRVSDHAELIAHHYGAALEFARASGGETGELAAKTRHFLVLAGDRAMALDVCSAERFYGRALELVAVDEPERAHVLARLADTAQEAGRLREAKARFEEAIAELEAHGEELSAARAMTRLAMTLWRLGDTARHLEVLDRAIDLLDGRQLGPDLARAWSLKARALEEAGRARDSLPWIDRAMRAAEQVDAVDVRVRLLQFRGLARADLGDAVAVEDLRESLRLGRELGLGFETAVAYTNLGDLVARDSGPADGLRVFRQAIDFSERRGLVHNAVLTKGHGTLLLVEMGAWDEARIQAAEVLSWDRREGPTHISAAALTAESQVLVNRGAVARAASVVAELLPLARHIRDLQSLVPALVVAAVVERRRENLTGAIELVKELEAATRRNPGWRSYAVADCVRVCVAASALPLAETLLRGTETRIRRGIGTTLSGRATLAEAYGDLASAVTQHAQAARLWVEFGHTLEHGYALLGQGRCLVRLGLADDAARRLEEAHAAFELLGARPLVDETEEWLAQALV